MKIVQVEGKVSDKLMVLAVGTYELNSLHHKFFSNCRARALFEFL